MKVKSQLTVSIAGRITLFLYLFTVLIMVLYIQGSFQGFVDNTLVMLLVLFKYSSLIFIAFAISYVTLLFTIGSITGRIVHRIIFTIIGLTFSLIFFIIVEIVITGLEPVM